MSKLSHVDATGRPTMVDVSGKSATVRKAVVEGRLQLKRSHLEALASLPKGDAITVAEIAGVMAGKKCSDLVPLCHPIPLSHIGLAIRLEDDGLHIRAEAATNAQTGVEMECYTAVAIAGVTLIDMLKGVDPDLTLSGIRLLEKTGGKSDWRR